MVKKRIIILSILIVLILAGSILWAYLIHSQKASGKVIAEIYRDNELIKRIDLKEKEEAWQFTIEYGENDFNTIEVRNGNIAIVEASCPDKVCKNMGFIHNSNMPITCLPNHLVIRIVEEEKAYDGFTY